MATGTGVAATNEFLLGMFHCAVCGIERSAIMSRSSPLACLDERLCDSCFYQILGVMWGPGREEEGNEGFALDGDVLDGGADRVGGSAADLQTCGARSGHGQRA